MVGVLPSTYCTYSRRYCSQSASDSGVSAGPPLPVIIATSSGYVVVTQSVNGSATSRVKSLAAARIVGHVGDHTAFVVDRDGEVAADRTDPTRARGNPAGGTRTGSAPCSPVAVASSLPAATELLLVSPCLVQLDRLSVVLNVFVDDLLGRGAVGEIRAGGFGVECGERLEELGSDLLGGQARLRPTHASAAPTTRIDSSVGVSSANMTAIVVRVMGLHPGPERIPHLLAEIRPPSYPFRSIEVILPSTTTTSVELVTERTDAELVRPQILSIRNPHRIVIPGPWSSTACAVAEQRLGIGCCGTLGLEPEVVGACRSGGARQCPGSTAA